MDAGRAAVVGHPDSPTEESITRLIARSTACCRTRLVGVPAALVVSHRPAIRHRSRFIADDDDGKTDAAAFEPSTSTNYRRDRRWKTLRRYGRG